MRQRFGSRSIDASAPQSARDSTPSGREAYRTGNKDQTRSGREAFARQRGDSDRQIAADEGELWGTLFPGTMGQPARAPGLAGFAKPVQPPGIVEQIGMAHSTGATSGFFQTPYGPAGFTSASAPPSLTPEQPPNASSVADYIYGITKDPRFLPQAGRQQRFRGSILEGTSRWIAPI